MEARSSVHPQEGTRPAPLATGTNNMTLKNNHLMQTVAAQHWCSQAEVSLSGGSVNLGGPPREGSPLLVLRSVV